MEKKGQVKVIFGVSIILIIAVILILFFVSILLFVLKDNEIKMSDDEITEIVKNITSDEIIKIEYYKTCFIGEEEYEKIYVVVTKLKEKYGSGIFGGFEYKYYFLNEEGKILSEAYNLNDKVNSCEKLE